MPREEDEEFQTLWSENDSPKRLHLSTKLNEITERAIGRAQVESSKQRVQPMWLRPAVGSEEWREGEEPCVGEGREVRSHV